MKSLQEIILEKLKIKKGYKQWDPEKELGISEIELQYIDTLILIANNEEVKKETVKIVYNAFTSEDNIKNNKQLENLANNIFKYLNKHPNLPELLGDTFDDIYAALRSLPEDELIQYRKTNNQNIKNK
jgi:hypothetical protein